MGIAALTVDGELRTSWATTDLNDFLGYLWPDKRYTTAGRKGPLGWRFLLLESVDYRQGIHLDATGLHLGERLVWYYAQ